MEKSIIAAEGIINDVLSAEDTISGSEFPLYIFPMSFQEIVRTTSRCMGYSLDFLASAMLFAISVAIGNTHKLHIKGDWSESPIMYLALVGKPGTNKSHPMSFAMKPLLSHDTAQYKIFKTKSTEYLQLASLSKKEREEMGVYELPAPPIFKKFVVSDVTQESLVYVHDQNQRGICLYVDELKTWINNFNRYAKGSEEQFWLSNFNGKPIIVDRRGSDNSISIPKTFISVIGSIQVSRLADLSKGERGDNGFIDRILFVVPKQMDKKSWSTDELPMYILSQWQEFVDKFIALELYTDSNGDPAPITVHYQDVAKNALFEWQRLNTDMCNNELNECLVSIYMKLEIYISRFALTIQLMKWASGEASKSEVDAKSVAGAIALVEYFRNTAQKVQSIINNNFIETLSVKQRAVYTALPDEFTTALGVCIAQKMNVKERTFKDFISRHIGTLFLKEKHGQYRKIIH